MTDSNTVLVVDDDRATRTAMSHLLEMEGYAVVSAENGAQALDLVVTEHPAVVLSDVRMPVMGGEELVAELQKRDGPPVILMTAHDLVDEESARRIGAAGLLRKPIDLHDLLGCLEKFVDPAEG